MVQAVMRNASHAAEERPVLLVGASGRVGRMVLHHWRAAGLETAVVPQYRQPGVAGGLLWDPLSGPALPPTQARRHGRFSAMVVLAGVTPASGQPLEGNLALAVACLKAAREAGIGRVLLASSSAVYGPGANLPEGAPCRPVNAYGRAKLAMEQACADWRAAGMDLCFLRIGNVAGADALLGTIAHAAPDAPVDIDTFDSGRGPVRSYIGPRTLAQVLQGLACRPAPLPAVLNIAAPVPVSMDALADAAGHPWRPRRPGAGAQPVVTLDCAALSALHPLARDASDPAEMVRQWRATTAP